MPSCPRCAYDLSGVVASWTASCPTEGVCSECGLAFAWREVLAERAVAPDWYVERTPGRLVRRWAGTWIREARPALLWGSLDMRMALHVRRLAMFVLAGPVASYVVLVGAAVAMQAWWHGQYVGFWSTRRPGRAMPTLWEWLDWGSIAWPFGTLFPEVDPVGLLTLGLVPVWMTLLMPLFCFLFSDTLRIEHVRVLHLVRVGALWLPTAMVSGTIVLAMTAPAQAVFAWMVAAQVVAVLTWLVWPLVYWWRAFGLYLRLRRPLLATIALFVASSVVTIALIVLVS